MSAKNDIYKTEGGFNRFTLRNIIYTSLKHWYVFLVIFLLAYGLKVFLVKYTLPKHKIWSSIYVRGDKKSAGGAGDFLEEMSVFGNTKSVQNEMEAMRSFQVIRTAVYKLNLNVSYFVVGNIREKELYTESPIIIQLDTTYQNIEHESYFLEIENDKEYSVYIKRESNGFWGSLNPVKFHEKRLVVKGEFDKICQSDFFRLTIHKSPDLIDNYKGDVNFYFKINNLDANTDEFQSRLKLDVANKYSNVITLSMVSSVPKKDVDFLNALMETFISNGLYEKNEMITNTVRFIDMQLMNISDSLKGVENELQNFGVSGNTLDSKSSSNIGYDKLTRLEQEKELIEVQKRYLQYLLEYISTERDVKYMLAPTTAGINDPLLLKIVEELMTLMSEQSNLPFSAREKNPTYKMLELRIQNTKKALIENINNLLAVNKIAEKDNAGNTAEVKRLLDELPQKERKFLDIKRRLDLNDNIYTYLLEKRIEASIAKAANVPDNKIMNYAVTAGMITPNVPLITRYTTLAIIFLPFLIVIAIIYLDNRVKNKKMLNSYSSIPMLGMVFHYNGEIRFPIMQSSKSRFSESIRSIRINLEFVLPEKKGKVVGLTSSISGEGKSFFSVNLASSIASTGSSVIIIGVDMRKPTLQDILNLSNNKGLSSYLIKKASLEEVICGTGVEGMDCILSGPIPPNPAELMASAQMNILLAELKEKYDYIILDSSPVMLVPDYYVLLKHIDANIFIARQNYSNIQMIKDISALVKDKSILNSFWVLNDVTHGSMSQYGYGYKENYTESEGYYEDFSKNAGQKLWARFGKLWSKVKN